MPQSVPPLLDAEPLAADVDVARIGRYRGHAELMAALDEMPGVHLSVAGQSVQKHDIITASFGDLESENVSVVLAGIHAMEWIGVEVAFALMEDLAQRPPEDRCVVVFPTVNIDGFLIAEADLRAGRRRFQRANVNGVDLNRNFPTHYSPVHLPSKVFSGLGHSGPHARSEPEVDSVCSTLDAIVAEGRTIDRAISLHSFGRVLLYPYGGRWASPPNVKAHRDAAEAMKRAIPTPYRPIQVSRWYPGVSFAHGLELDDLAARYDALSILVECSKGGMRISDPSSWFHPWRWYNPTDPARVAGELRGPLRDFLLGRCP